jgi:hypothetical protein
MRWPEAVLLVGQLLGHEGDAEQLPVRVQDRRPRLAPVVDDGLRVADAGGLGVVLEPVPQRRHDQAGLLVVEVGPGGVVLGREHQDLVDARRPGLGEHGAEVLDGERVLAGEGGIGVGHDPDQPLAARAVRLERRRRRLLVPRAEGAGAGVGLDGEHPRIERRGSERAVTRDRHPPTRKRVQPELTHDGITAGDGTAARR